MKKTSLSKNLLLQPNKCNKILLTVILLFSLQFISNAQTIISSLEEFISLQDSSYQDVKMTPGTYHVSSSTKTLFEDGDWIVRTRGNWPGLFDFTGSNNTFDLTGVTFTFDSTIINDMPNLAHGSLVRLGGTNNTWLGFNLQELAGNDGKYGVYISVSGGVILQITGSNHRFEDLTLKARYSHPYGFGSIYGKTGSSSGMLPGLRLGKKSGLLLTELTNSTFDNILVDHSAFGHTLFFNGPINNVVIENATIIAESRSTNDIRTNGIDGTDRNGVPFGLNYDGTVLTGAADNGTFFNYFDTDNLDQCQSLDSGFQGSPIRNNYQFSLTESAFRGYNQDLIENLTIRNAYVVGARSGIALGSGGNGLVVENITIKGVAGHGVPACDGVWNSDNGGEGDATAFDIPSYAVIKNAQADAAYSTVLELSSDRQEITADIEILDPDNGYLRPSGSTALALISGSDHKLRLWKRDGQALDEDLVIKVGNESTSGLTLCNMTRQSITLSNNVTNSTIYTIGDVIDSSNGSNTIINVSNLSQEPCECASIGTLETTSTSLCGNPSFTPDPNKTYYIDSAHHNARIAATGESNDTYTTNEDTTGEDVEWKFVAKGNGYWHIQRAAGGSKPRLRRDNSSFADMQQTTSSGSWTYYEITTGYIADSYFLTLPDSPTTNNRLQINNSLQVKTVASANHNGTWESFTITEASSINDDGSTLVHITKRNATGYAIDGGNGGANLQDVALSSANTSDEGQLWNEIDRGNGYYSYEKYGTNYSLDGNGGGANNQSVYLWETSDTNQNQQWQKVAMGDGGYKLIKRNADGFAINGGSGGLEGRDINLYDSGNSSQNLQWYITPISTNLQSNKETEVISTISDVIMYPNPVNNITTIKGAANSNIIIYDINGRIVLEKSILIENEAIDLGNLTYGIYYVKVISIEKSTTIKLIKN